MSDNVVRFPAKLSSVDEVMRWLNERHAAGKLKELTMIAADTDGHYEIGISRSTAVQLLYASTYLHETVMNTLRDCGVMPRPGE